LISAIVRCTPANGVRSSPLQLARISMMVEEKAKFLVEKKKTQTNLFKIALLACAVVRFFHGFSAIVHTRAYHVHLSLSSLFIDVFTCERKRT
jgi:hypothetical protein